MYMSVLIDVFTIIIIILLDVFIFLNGCTLSPTLVCVHADFSGFSFSLKIFRLLLRTYQEWWDLQGVTEACRGAPGSRTPGKHD